MDLLPYLPKVDEKGRWYECSEHLPTDYNTIYIVYSAPFGDYYFSKFSPYSGWIWKTRSFISITHWLDQKLPFKFELRQEYDPKIAEIYGIEKSSHPFQI